MLKLIYCMTRRTNLSRADFQAYLQTKHAAKVDAAREALGIRRYVQNLTTPTTFAGPLREFRGLSPHEHDAVVELWFDSEEALTAALKTPQGQKHLAILAADEAQIVEFGRSHLHFCTETVVID